METMERVECAFCGASMLREGGLYHQGLHYCGSCPVNAETEAAAKVRTPTEVLEACKVFAANALRGFNQTGKPAGMPEPVLNASIELSLLLMEADQTPGGKEWVEARWLEVDAAVMEALEEKHATLHCDFMMVGMLTEVLRPEKEIAEMAARRELVERFNAWDPATERVEVPNPLELL